MSSSSSSIVKTLPLYPDILVRSILLESDSGIPAVCVQLLLKDEPVNILLGYEYLLHRFIYVYNSIKEHINDNYPFYKNLWTDNKYCTIGFYFPPIYKSNFVNSSFMVIVNRVCINNNNSCSTFYNLVQNNLYYENNFNYIPVDPSYGGEYRALLLVIPRPDNGVEPSKYIDKPIQNINQFEQNYELAEREEFYRMVIQKMYESLFFIDFGVTLWFAGAQIGCLHAKITEFKYYANDILMNRLNFRNARIFGALYKLIRSVADNNFAQYISELMYLQLAVQFDKQYCSFISSVYHYVLSDEKYYPYVKQILHQLVIDTEGGTAESETTVFLEQIFNTDFRDVRAIDSFSVLGGAYKKKYKLMTAPNNKLITLPKKLNNKPIIIQNIKNNVNKPSAVKMYNNLEDELSASFPNYSAYILSKIITLAEDRMANTNKLSKVINKQDIPQIQEICIKYYRPRFSYSFDDALYDYILLLGFSEKSTSLLVSSINIDETKSIFKYLNVPISLQNTITKYVDKLNLKTN
jgi:hypothetical protein